MTELPAHSGKNPWTTHASEEVYESPWIKVTKHDVSDPNGNPGTYSVVHFRNLAIGIVPLDKEMNTWLVGQFRYPINEYTWEIPEGGGKIGIAPLDSARRELKEEAGIVAAKWTLIQEMQLSNSATDEYCYLYVAQDLEIGDAQPEPDEDLQLVKIPFEEVYRMVCDGRIKDSLSVTAVLKIKLLLLSGTLP